MWKDSIRNIVVILQPNILRIVGFYVRHSATVQIYKKGFILFSAKYFNPRKWASNGPRLLSAALASQCDLSPDEFSHTLSIGPGKDVSDQNYVEKTVIILKGILRNILQEIM